MAVKKTKTSHHGHSDFLSTLCLKSRMSQYVVAHKKSSLTYKTYAALNFLVAPLPFSYF